MNRVMAIAEIIVKAPGTIYGVAKVNLKPLPTAIKAKIAGIREVRVCARLRREALR